EQAVSLVLAGVGGEGRGGAPLLLGPGPEPPPPGAHPPGVEEVSLFASWLAARRRPERWLAPCESVGAGAVLEGAPTLGSEGHLRVGARFHLASLPMQSHIVVGKGATLE